MQALKECVFRRSLARMQTQAAKFLRSRKQQNKASRAETYLITRASRIKTYSAARASLKFKLRFAAELQTKPVRQTLPSCAIKFDFSSGQNFARKTATSKQDQINSFSKGCIALPSASKSTRPHTSQTSSLGEGSSASSCHADISPHSQFMT